MNTSFRECAYTSGLSLFPKSIYDFWNTGLQISWLYEFWKVFQKVEWLAKTLMKGKSISRSKYCLYQWSIDVKIAAPWWEYWGYWGRRVEKCSLHNEAGRPGRVSSSLCVGGRAAPLCCTELLCWRVEPPCHRRVHTSGQCPGVGTQNPGPPPPLPGQQR